MKKFKLRVISLTVIGIILIPTMVLADYKSDIIDSCSTEQQGKDKSEINACKLYIDGFIDSSLLTEDAVIQTKAMLNSQPQEQSAFLKRAYKTRVNDASFIKSHQEYQFCLPRKHDRRAIASNIAKSLDTSQ